MPLLQANEGDCDNADTVVDLVDEKSLHTNRQFALSSLISIDSAYKSDSYWVSLQYQPGRFFVTDVKENADYLIVRVPAKQQHGVKSHSKRNVDAGGVTVVPTLKSLAAFQISSKELNQAVEEVGRRNVLLVMKPSIARSKRTKVLVLNKASDASYVKDIETGDEFMKIRMQRGIVYLVHGFIVDVDAAIADKNCIVVRVNNGFDDSQLSEYHQRFYKLRCPEFFTPAAPFANAPYYPLHQAANPTRIVYGNAAEPPSPFISSNGIVKFT